MANLLQRPYAHSCGSCFAPISPAEAESIRSIFASQQKAERESIRLARKHFDTIFDEVLDISHPERVAAIQPSRHFRPPPPPEFLARQRFSLIADVDEHLPAWIEAATARTLQAKRRQQAQRLEAEQQATKRAQQSTAATNKPRKRAKTSTKRSVDSTAATAMQEVSGDRQRENDESDETSLQLDVQRAERSSRADDHRLRTNQKSNQNKQTNKNKNKNKNKKTNKNKNKNKNKSKSKPPPKKIAKSYHRQFSSSSWWQ